MARHGIAKWKGGITARLCCIQKASKKKIIPANLKHWHKALLMSTYFNSPVKNIAWKVFTKLKRCRLTVPISKNHK